MTSTGGTRGHHFPGFGQLFGHDAGHRRGERGVLQLLLERGDGGLRRGDARLRDGDLLRAGRGVDASQHRLRGVDTVVGGGQPRFGDVEPRGGVVALLLRAALAFEQQLEALQVGGRGFQFRLRGGDVGACGVHLRFGLTHVLGAGGDTHQPELRFGRRLVGAGAGDGQLDVGGVEGEDAGAGRDAIAFLDVEGGDATADLGSEADVGGLDVAGGAQAIGVRGLLARGGGEGQGDERGERCRRWPARDGAGVSVGHRERSFFFFGAAPSGASMRSAVCCMCATSWARSTATNIGSSSRPGRAAARSRTAFIISGPMIDM